jgi:hypothetical protein
MTWK